MTISLSNIKLEWNNGVYILVLYHCIWGGSLVNFQYLERYGFY